MKRKVQTDVRSFFPPIPAGAVAAVIAAAPPSPRAVKIGKRGPTQTELKQFFQSIIRAPGKINESDTARLQTHFEQHHPRWIEKRQDWNGEFWVKPSVQGSLCVHLKKHDDTFEQISLKPTYAPPGSREDVLRALRTEIQPQIKDFNDHWEHAPSPCGICGEDLSSLSRDKRHVDHVVQFANLVRSFCAEHELQLLDIGTIKGNQLQEVVKGGTFTWMRDRELAQKWEVYHRSCAVLRMTCETCNLARPRKE